MEARTGEGGEERARPGEGVRVLEIVDEVGALV